MARSEIIWMVSPAYESPDAVFTVKHELLTYLRKQSVQDLPGLDISRYHDGPGGGTKTKNGEYSITADKFLASGGKWA